MSATSLSTIFSVGSNVVKTQLNDGDSSKNVVSYQIVRVQGDSTPEEAEYWGPPGLASLPPASSGKQDDAAQTLSINMAGDHLVIGTRDHRTNYLYGQLKPGESCLHGGGVDGNAQGRVIVKQDGSVTNFTSDTNIPGGSSVYSRVAPDGFTWVAPWGKMVFDESGLHVVHKSGAAFDLGGIVGLPSPLDALTSYVRVTGATFTADAAMTSLGAGAATPIPNSPALVAALEGLQAQIALLETQIVAINVWIAGMTTAAATPPTSTTFTLFGLAMAPLGLAVSSLNDTLTAIPLPLAVSNTEAAIQNIPQTTTSAT